MVRTLFAGAALILTASAAGAQITTFIAPARPVAESREMMAIADSAKRDSTAVATMANMKAWVDSAAGVTVPSTVGQVDSAALVNDPGRPVTTFSEGTVAPATASALPALALIGIVLLSAGVILLRNPLRD